MQLNITEVLEEFLKTKSVRLPARLLVQNPFDVAFTMFAVDGVVYVSPPRCGGLHAVMRRHYGSADCSERRTALP
jgi:hypothetical protein